MDSFSAQLPHVSSSFLLSSSPFSSYKYTLSASFFSHPITKEARSPSSSFPSSFALRMSRAVASTGLIALIKRRAYSTAAMTRMESEARAADSRLAAPSTSPKSSSASSSSWVPDPVTGYYRPGNRRAEIDAAEMRESLLTHHKTQE